jgi:hypothetical protein
VFLVFSICYMLHSTCVIYNTLNVNASKNITKQFRSVFQVFRLLTKYCPIIGSLYIYIYTGYREMPNRQIYIHNVHFVDHKHFASSETEEQATMIGP